MELNKIICGNALDVLKTFPNQSVDCVITSPPYWGLRDYGEATRTVWGGDKDCDHEWEDNTFKRQSSDGKACLNRWSSEAFEELRRDKPVANAFCTKCNAWSGPLGLEPTFQLYIQHLLEIFAEVKRVLKDTGTCWVNLGDTYCSGTRDNKNTDLSRLKSKEAKHNRGWHIQPNRQMSDYPSKSLCLIPQRFSIGMVDELGWILRNTVIWCLSGITKIYAKTNNGARPMMLKDIYRTYKDRTRDVELWNGERWTPITHICERVSSNAIEIELRNGEKIISTPEHKWVLENAPLLEINTRNLHIGDVIRFCDLPEPFKPETPYNIPDWVGYIVGLYLAEGSKGSQNGKLQFSLHAKENKLADEVKKFADAYGGTFKEYNYSNCKYANIHSIICESIIDTYIEGDDSKNKHLNTKCWQRSNLFLRYLLDGYLDGDGYFDVKTERYSIGFTNNCYLADDLRTLCSRLGYSLRLRKRYVKYQYGRKLAYTGKLIRNSQKRRTEDREVIAIRQITGERKFYDISVEHRPYLFALSSGTCTHNSKPNAMPSSAKDRFTVDFEYLFFFVKNKKYYFEQQFEPHQSKNISSEMMKSSKWGKKKKATCKPNVEQYAKKGNTRAYYPQGRNKRTVWTISTKPFSEAHFAVFPKELIEPCIQAGCPPQGVVLDPFIGSGTTAIAALLLGRKYLGIELNKSYIEMAETRIKNECGLLNSL